MKRVIAAVKILKEQLEQAILSAMKDSERVLREVRTKLDSFAIGSARDGGSILRDGVKKIGHDVTSFSVAVSSEMSAGFSDIGMILNRIITQIGQIMSKIEAATKHQIDSLIQIGESKVRATVADVRNLINRGVIALKTAAKELDQFCVRSIADIKNEVTSRIHAADKDLSKEVQSAPTEMASPTRSSFITKEVEALPTAAERTVGPTVVAEAFSLMVLVYVFFAIILLVAITYFVVRYIHKLIPGRGETLLT